MKALRLLTAALVAALSLWAVPGTVLADAYYQLTPSTDYNYTWYGTAGDRLADETANYKFDYGDEGTVSFTLPWNFRFYGKNYTQITADTNGNIWLGTAIPSPIPNSFALASTGPVISVWNNDLSSYYDGGVFIEHKSSPERVVVHWRTETFPDAGYGRNNEFEAVLFANGTIRFDYASFNEYAVGDSGSGISKGDGIKYLSKGNYLPLNGYGDLTTLAERSFTYAPDLTPPALSINPVTSPTNVLSQMLSGTMEDGAQVTVFNTTNSQFSTVTYPESTTWNAVVSLDENANTIRVSASDPSNNSTTAEVYINRDTTGPTVSIASPAPGLTNNNTPQVTYSLSEGVPVVILDEVTVNKPSGSYLDPLADGAYMLRVEAADALGNPGFAQVSFTVDTVAPTVTVNPVSSPSRNLVQTLTGTREEGQIITVTVNTTATVDVSYPGTTTWQCTVANLAAGDNSFTITAQDAAGNITSVIALLQYIPLALNVTPAVVPADYQGMVTLAIENLASTGGSAFIEVLLDANQNDQADANEPVIRSLKVTDGVGSINPNVAGDSDGTTNNTIVTSLDYLLKLDANHAPGSYLIRVSEGTGRNMVASLAITPVVQLQTISGTITDGLNPISGALVRVVDKWQRPIGYVAADSQGQYLLDIKVPGDYRLIPLASGFSTSKTAAPLVTLAAGQNITAVDLTVTAGVYTITGRVIDQGTSTGIDGVRVMAESMDYLGTSLTDVDGNYSLVLPAGDYQVNVDGSTAAAKGYLRTGGSQVNLTGDRSGVDLGLQMATVFASGMVSDEFGVGVAGVPIQGISADDSIEAHAVSDTSGNYTLGLSLGNGWTVSLIEQMEYLGTRISNLDLNSSVTGKNLSAWMVNAWIQGSVKDAANDPIPGVIVSGTTQLGLQQKVATATDGTYLLGAFPGTWQIFADTQALGCEAVSEQETTLTLGQTAVAEFLNVKRGPTSITVPASSDTTENYIVSWGASPTSGVRYTLQEATNSSFSTGLRTVVTGTTSLSSVISERSVGSTYYYRVRAEMGGTISAWLTGGNGCVISAGAARTYYGRSWDLLSGTWPGPSGNVMTAPASHNIRTTFNIATAGTARFTWSSVNYGEEDVTIAVVLNGALVFSDSEWNFNSGRIVNIPFPAGSNTFDFILRGAGSDDYINVVDFSLLSGVTVPLSIAVPVTSAVTNYNISWAASPTAGVTYRLEEATNSAFNVGLRTVVSGTTSLATAISGRTNGLIYYYRVRAEKNGIFSAWRTGVNGCSVGNIGPPITITVPTTSSTGNYTISWGSSVTPSVVYTLQEATNSSFTAGLRTVVSGTANKSVVISGRASGVTYYYRVRAEKSGFTSTMWTNGVNGCSVVYSTNCTVLYSGSNIFFFNGSILITRPVTIKVTSGGLFWNPTFTTSNGLHESNELSIEVYGTSLYVDDPNYGEITRVEACY